MTALMNRVRPDVRAYANRLASYISDASTVRTLCKREFGQDVAVPPRHIIEEMRAKHMRPRIKMRRQVARRDAGLCE